MNTNFLLQVVRRSQRCKCRGADKSGTPSTRCTRLAEYKNQRALLLCYSSNSSLSHSLLQSSQKLMECVQHFFFFFNVYDDDECGEGASFYSLSMTVCSCILGKHRMEPPPHALNASLEKCGARWSQGVRAHLGCVRTLGVWAPSQAWASSVLVFYPGVEFEWDFAYILLECTFLIVHFGVFSYLCLQNMYTPKLMENVSCKP